MSIIPDTSLPADLAACQAEAEHWASHYGLDFYPTVFELVDAEQLNAIAAYGGFPTRYPHWRFGMEYERLAKGYNYGLQKIYELVINNDPCYAYLMNCNGKVDQKLVMAHVYGHCDFFKNNHWFSHTNRKMMDEMANHGNRIRRYMDRFGQEEVEEFIDACLSIEDLIDIHSPHIKRRDDRDRYEFPTAAEDDAEPVAAGRFQAKGYMDSFINPPDRLAAETARLQAAREKSGQFPSHPERDVMLFLLEHAPLKPWQVDVLAIIRDEAYYFAPQGQTKIMNEGWACALPGTLVVTDRGLRPIEELVAERAPWRVSDGHAPRRILDWAKLEDRETVTIRTRRGLVLGGSTTHRVRLADGSWRRLDALETGDRLEVAHATNLWPERYVEVDWRPRETVRLRDAAERAGVSYYTVRRYRQERDVRRAAEVGAALRDYREGGGTAVLPAARRTIRVPRAVDERLAALLGYLVGDGHVSDAQKTIGLTTGDRAQADRFAALVEELFGIAPRLRLDGRRWRVTFSSRNARDFLVHLGLKTGRAARRKTVPDCILRSPAGVVAAFLRALFDCDGYAGRQGVILSTASDKLGEVVQLLLLNFGILSRRRKQKSDGCWHINIFGEAARRFAERVGFGLERKQAALESYLHDRKWFKQMDEADEVVSIERGRGDVYDLTVAETHRYAAQGLVNHNSYWHSTIMTRNTLLPDEFICYCDHHSGTLATSPARLNPYKLGIELFRDIEQRWNQGRFGKDYEECDDIVAKREWNTGANLGREKIFEVRRVHNDLTFIDTFLTLDFCRQYKLFQFGYNPDTDYYEIESRAFPKIKRQLLDNLTNMSRPQIAVRDANYKNRGELFLEHTFTGVELKIADARDTLVNLHRLWSRPVHIETVLDNHVTILSYDGAEHQISKGKEVEYELAE